MLATDRTGRGQTRTEACNMVHGELCQGLHVWPAVNYTAGLPLDQQGRPTNNEEVWA